MLPHTNSIHLSPLLGGLLGLIGGGLLACPQALHLLPLTLDHLWVLAVIPTLSQSLVDYSQILNKSCYIAQSLVEVNHLLQPRNLRLQPAFARLLQLQFAAEICRLSVIGYYVLAHLSNSLNLSSSLLCWPTVTVSPL